MRDNEEGERKIMTKVNQHQEPFRSKPKFILFDGEGKYIRKVITENRNKQEEADIFYSRSLEREKPEEFRYQKITSSNAVEMQERSKNHLDSRFPKISFNRVKINNDIGPMKPQITKELIEKFGKYTYRNSEKTDIFLLKDEQRNTNIKNAYQAVSDQYGRFYYNDSNKSPRQQAIESYNQELSPTFYKRFDVEKPYLQYHNLKSQLFKSPERK